MRRTSSQMLMPPAPVKAAVGRASLEQLDPAFRESGSRASVLIESEPEALIFCFDAFSLREPVSTSLENAPAHAERASAAKATGFEGASGATQPGNRLLLDFDDVTPYGPGCLVTLRRKIRPGFRLVKCHCVVKAVPFDDGHTLGSRGPVYLDNPSARGA
jgi:hypothetical protein